MGRLTRLSRLDSTPIDPPALLIHTSLSGVGTVRAKGQRTTHMIDPEEQLKTFRLAVTLLGGQRSAAAAMTAVSGMSMNERTMRALWGGERTLHEGYLRDIAKALIAHADACRMIERKLSPAFAGNLTTDQATKPPHNRTNLRRKEA